MTSNTRDKDALIDQEIGRRLKILRLKQGRSLDDIGKVIGVSFQQVQKYEKGVNRISCTYLYQIAEFLKAPSSYFFDDLLIANNILGETRDAFNHNDISDLELSNLIKYYSAISHKETRRKILDLLKTISRQD
jgi:transcriptional regulator with XRE-family HTH domain